VICVEQKIIVNNKLINHKTEKAILLEVPVRYYNTCWGIWLPKVFTEANDEERTIELNLPSDFKYELVAIKTNNYDKLTGREGDMLKWSVSEEDFESFFTRYNMNLAVIKNDIEQEIKQLIQNYDSVLKGFDNLQDITEKAPLKIFLEKEDFETLEQLKIIIKRINDKKETMNKLLRLPGE